MGGETLGGMDLECFTYHGGNLGAARALFPDAPAPWIDLSTGINPHAYPAPDLPREAWTRLPDGADIARLEAITAARYGAPDSASVIAGAGTQSLIQAIAGLAARSRVGVFGETYSGHARAWRAAGARVETVATLEALAAFDSVAKNSKQANIARLWSIFVRRGQKPPSESHNLGEASGEARPA